MKNKLLILKDYRSHFYSSTISRGASMNLTEIKNGFEKIGYDVIIKNFSEINFKCENYNNVIVVYQSTEDPALSYKDYIEDILLGLQLQGAILIPDFFKFRAHHNKVFMEILRVLQPCKEIQNLSAHFFGTFEEYNKFNQCEKFPFILKSSYGSKSGGVFLARNKTNAKNIVKKISSTPSFFNLYWLAKNLWDKKGYFPISNHRKKFIIQNYISDLSGDYKIIIYNSKYFVLFRNNRPNDFRASGSGRLQFPDNVPDIVLNYAKIIFKKFNVPFISIDIGYNGKECFLFEFQFISFGQYAVDKSPWHFIFENNKWILIKENTNAEREFVSSIDAYIKNNSFVKSIEIILK